MMTTTERRALAAATAAARYKRIACYCESRIQPAQTIEAREAWQILSDRAWLAVCKSEEAIA